MEYMKARLATVKSMDKVNIISKMVMFMKERCSKE